MTIGPGGDPKSVSKLGHAAHIYSAAISGRGPRGNKKLTSAELKSPANAIWLCPYHANLIDKNNGTDYPAPKLHTYKDLHESLIAHELRGESIPFCWVDRVTIQSSPLFAEDTELSFSKLNLILGRNSVGKTALCEWIAGYSNATYLERWRTIYPPYDRRLLAEMHYRDPHPHRIVVDFRQSNYPRYLLDNRKTASSAIPLKILYPNDLRSELKEQPDDLTALVSTMGLPMLEVRSLCNSLDDDIFREVSFREHDGRFYLNVSVQTVHGHVRDRTLRTLSGSEMCRFLVQLSMKAANMLASVSPTLLILDSAFWRLDENWLRQYAEVLSSPSNRFQTIATTHREGVDFEDVAWTGWQLIHLQGTPPRVSVSSGFAGPSV